MLTTHQVRAVLSQQIQRNFFNPFWTNKTSKTASQVRSVKAYLDGNPDRVIAALVKAGVERRHINLTPGSPHRGHPGITIKCILA